MKQYKFGRGELAKHVVGNKLYVSRLDKIAKPNDTVAMTKTDAIVLSFASIKAINQMITDLQSMKKHMYKVKLHKLLGLV